MIEYDVTCCPKCDKEINVKVFKQFKNIHYIVEHDCPHCKESAERIENLLNKKNKKQGRIKTEKSYIKLDPRG